MDALEEYGDHTQIESKTLTDSSVAYNVIYNDGTITLRFGCVSERAAMDLADHLERASWVELENALTRDQAIVINRELQIAAECGNGRTR